MKRILFIWPGLTGYMGDCWRTLQTRATVKILIDGKGLGENFTDDVMQGLDWERVTEEEVVEKIKTFAPDALVVVGWRGPVSRRVVFSSTLDGIPKFLVMDLPWRWSLRCLAARFVLGRYLRRFRGVFVHGEPSARYARVLGFDENQIHRHCICGIDLNKWRPSAAPSERKDFLFVGRKVREKGIDTLKAAFEIYQKSGGRWSLTMPAWIDPNEVPQMMQNHACLVLPSRWEPWGVVVAEAKAAGMKVIVSDRVNARFDLSCDWVVRAGEVKALAEAMRRMETSASPSADDLSFWSCASWADRVCGAIGIG